MKKNTIIFVIFVLFIFFPNLLSAVKNEEIKENEKSNYDNYILISRTEKYYKTINYKKNINSIHNYNYMNNIDNDSNVIDGSITYEITKEEYESFDNNIISPQSTTIETNYKKLTSSIYQNNSYFKYEAVLTWKNFPSKRSYDIIGIGFYGDVKPLSSPSYSTKYCLSNNSCRTITSHSPKTFANGVGTTFQLPAGDLTSLVTTFSVIMTKNSSNSITKQIAAADYSHATSNISLNNAKNFSVNASGITLNGISSYYDSIQTATTDWYGNW